MFCNGIVRLNQKGYVFLFLVFLIMVYYHFTNGFKRDDNSRINLSSLLQTAILAAEVGGQFVVQVRNNPEVHYKGKTKEGLDDSVTNADFLSHCAMVKILTGKFPTVKFISEEKNIPCDIKQKIPNHDIPINLSNKFANSNDVTIWIDPLDATHEYTEKLFKYVTTMVCIAVKGEPIIGIIHNPFENTTSWAMVGGGTSDDLKNPKPVMEDGKVKFIISRSHRGTVEQALEKNFKNYEVVIAAGAGYKVLKVAKGEVDAYIHITAIKKWDICAGNAILRALGGQMTTKDGQLLTYLDDTDVVNKDGLIATLKYHDFFTNKL
ncbi:putative inositol monophosphatase 3 [Sitophilus oryzae]|uniref:inositol-phosphate phosphatase n=1 Tax=Sitophilus oryzae TaxID=7048 RepID=A0A6J2YAL2_SITOR|nr:putative inositol monophosphatase 3 [Sitophilus oryzae]